MSQKADELISALHEELHTEYEALVSGVFSSNLKLTHFQSRREYPFFQSGDCDSIYVKEDRFPELHQFLTKYKYYWIGFPTGIVSNPFI